MNMRTFARFFGIVFLLVGIMGFIPPLLVQHDHAGHDAPLTVNAFEGHLLGLFHVNILHSLVHVLFGVWGLMASRSYDASRTYARGTSIIYLLLAVMGLIPGLNTMFGLVPLHGHDVWLHLVLGGIAGYFGFVKPAVTDMRTDEYGAAGTARTDAGLLDDDAQAGTVRR